MERSRHGEPLGALRADPGGLGILDQGGLGDRDMAGTGTRLGDRDMARGDRESPAPPAAPLQPQHLCRAPAQGPPGAPGH